VIEWLRREQTGRLHSIQVATRANHERGNRRRDNRRIVPMARTAERKFAAVAKSSHCGIIWARPIFGRAPEVKSG
jgi:hypothetical protein